MFQEEITWAVIGLTFGIDISPTSGKSLFARPRLGRRGPSRGVGHSSLNTGGDMFSSLKVLDTVSVVEVIETDDLSLE
jgi:hypothetical protein